MRPRAWSHAIRHFGVSLLVAVLGLVILEGLVRLWAPQAVRFEMVRGESLAIADSVLGWRNRPNAIAVQSGPEFVALYEINGQGLRDHVTHAREKPAGTRRILLLGDSFTFGYANRYPDIWPVLLEKDLANKGLAVECIKAGVPGYDTRKEALYLPEAIEAFRPDLVLVVLLPNDLLANRPLYAPTAPLHSDHVVIRPEDKPKGLALPTLLARKLMQYDGPYVFLYRITGREALFSKAGLAS